MARSLSRAAPLIAALLSACSSGGEGQGNADGGSRAARPGSELPTSEAARARVQALAPQIGGGHGVASSFELRDAWIVPRLPTELEAQVERPARVSLAPRADGGFRIEDVGSELSVEVALSGSRDVPAEAVDGRLIYRGGGPLGADVVQRPVPDGTEDFVALPTRPATPELQYEIRPDARVAGLRLVEGVLELLDAGGVPRLRMAAPYVVDAAGERRAASVEVEGCVVDRSPAAPWRHPVVARGAGACRVSVRWAEDLAYPVAVDPAWTTTGSMATTRGRHSATLLADGDVLVAGGIQGLTVLSSAELYDSATGTFAATASMATPRSYHTGTLRADDRLMVIGGWNASDSYLASAERFTPSSGTWSTLTSMTTARRGHTATLLDTGKILVVGGYNGGTLSSAELYDPTTLWDPAPNLPSARQNHSANLRTDGNVMIVGGETSGGAASATVYRFTPSTGAWSTLSSLTTARTEHSAVALSNAELLVVGGSDGTNALSSAEHYASASWSSAGSLASARLDAFAVGFGANRVVVGGGRDGSTYLTSSEVWSGGTSWYPAANTVNKHAYPAAVLLTTGSVLVTGGYTASLTQTASAELFAQLANGGGCTTTGQCSSLLCADAHCCAATCTGTCQSCANSSGTCNTVASADDADTCTGTNTCSATGACKLESGQTCTTGSQCASGYCIDGYCCGTACSGSCDVCSLALGSTANGTCKNAPSSYAGNPACVGYLCGGSASTCPTTCTDDARCASGYYCATNNTCQPQKLQGVACNAADGDTTPGADCNVASCRVCASGNCVDGYCCNGGCNLACDVCASASGASTNGTCGTAKAGYAGGCTGNFACNGSSTSCPSNCSSDLHCQAGFYCDAGGQCRASKATGATCNTAAGADCLVTDCRECTTGFCADGFCCNTSCAGQCDTCALSLGAPANGTCGNLPAGNLGSPACVGGNCTGASVDCPAICTTDAGCAANYYCDASGKCKAQKVQASACNVAAGQDCKVQGCRVCSTGQCVDGACCNTACAGACDECSTGTCVARTGPGSPSCTPYLCDGSAAGCPTVCDADGDCIASDFCQGTTCVAKKTNGAACSDPDSCASGFCHDNVCCNAACSGTCLSCAASAGTCTTVSGAADADTCAAPSTCDTIGQCKLSTGQPCTTASECASGSCADGFCCNSDCLGACNVCAQAQGASADGVCSPLATGASGFPTCAPFACAGSASCPATCGNDAHCAAGYYCDAAGACTPQKVQGSACDLGAGQSCKQGGCRACQSGQCVDGFCCDSACSDACDTCAQSLGAAQDGSCTASPAGSTGTPSCNAYVCTGSSSQCPSDCSSDAQCAASHYCSAAGTCSPRKGQAASCDIAAGQDCLVAGCRACSSSACVDGYCCDTSCAGQCDVCSLALGATQNGTCANAPSGFVGSPACPGLTCTGASADCPSSCAADADCAAGYFCDASGKCKAERVQGAACDPGAGADCLVSGCRVCSTGFCVDGVCCNSDCSGACDECASLQGTCASAAPGSPGSPSCAPFECSGASGQCPGVCGSDAVCATGRYCDGSACVPQKNLGEACALGNECGGGHCVDGVCCNSACAGPCDACDASGQCQNVTGAGVPGCGGYQCSGSNPSCPASCADDGGCLPSHYCSAGNCLLRSPLGQACTSATECGSGHCVDGFCCDQPCDAPCQACAAALKQSASADGACDTARAGLDPHASCATDDPSTCDRDGTCDGLGGCAVYVAGTSCKAADCVSNTANSYTCDGTGACVVATSSDCGTFGCQAGACSVGCTSDTDCTSSSWCDGTKCVAKTAPGTTCSEARTCVSGFCADGVCCSAACTGQCESCNLPTATGTCTPVNGAPPGGRPACATAAGSDPCAARACDGTRSTTECLGYVGSSVACRPQACVAGVETFGASCEGSGQCPAERTKACPPYACGADSCKSTCSAPGDCSAGSTCDVPSGHCVSGTTCDGEHTITGQNGETTDCTPYRCNADGSCKPSCSSTADCTSGNVCASGACVAGGQKAASADEGGCGCRAPARVQVNGRALLALSLALVALGRTRARRRRDGRATTVA